MRAVLNSHKTTQNASSRTTPATYEYSLKQLSAVSGDCSSNTRETKASQRNRPYEIAN